jgi:hypothetical protein
MIILLIIAAWIVVSAVVAGLCATARVGDVELITRAYAPAAAGQEQPGQEQPGQAQLPAWDAAQAVEISVRANARAGRSAEADAPLLQSGGLAA